MKRILNLIFPPFCVHCHHRVELNAQLFCKGCSSFFELIDPKTRCPYCFSENDGRKPCLECVKKKRFQVHIGSALDYFGAVETFVKHLKYGNMPYLAKTGAAFMLAQFARLEWPDPDLIIPVPRRHWFQGINHALVLAKQFSLSLKVPCVSLIARRSGDFSQARLTKQQREELPHSSFSLKNSCCIEGKVILLIDDVVTTGTTIWRSAEALFDGFPEKIYALTLARSFNNVRSRGQ